MYAGILGAEGESPELVERAVADRFGRKVLHSTVANTDSTTTPRLHRRLEHDSEGRRDARIEKLNALEGKHLLAQVWQSDGL